jgi:hypothetical protein
MLAILHCPNEAFERLLSKQPFPMQTRQNSYWLPLSTVYMVGELADSFRTQKAFEETPSTTQNRSALKGAR